MEFTSLIILIGFVVFFLIVFLFFKLTNIKFDQDCNYEVIIYLFVIFIIYFYIFYYLFKSCKSVNCNKKN